MKLENAEVAAKYEAAFNEDQTVTLPGLYSGKLSKITIEAADKLMLQKSNLLIPKKAEAQKATPPKPEEAKK